MMTRLRCLLFLLLLVCSLAIGGREASSRMAIDKQGKFGPVESAMEVAREIGNHAVVAACRDGALVFLRKRTPSTSWGGDSMVTKASTRWVADSSRILQLENGLQALATGLPSDCSRIRSVIQSSCAAFRRKFGIPMSLQKLSRSVGDFLHLHGDDETFPLAVQVFLLQSHPEPAISQVTSDGIVQSVPAGGILTTWTPSVSAEEKANEDDEATETDDRIAALLPIHKLLCSLDTRSRGCHDVFESVHATLGLPPSPVVDTGDAGLRRVSLGESLEAYLCGASRTPQDTGGSR